METACAIKNPVGVGETYGARREETLRNTVTAVAFTWFAVLGGFLWCFRRNNQTFLSTFRTFAEIERHGTTSDCRGGWRFTVMKLFNINRLATPGIKNNR